MTQNDQSNISAELAAPAFLQSDVRKAKEQLKKVEREWSPEDDDDWYEPDCCRRENGSVQ